ncbi:hypothetical protein Trydic_g14463 [Trypoxylus dichotomus]
MIYLIAPHLKLFILSDTQQVPSEVNASSGKRISEKLKKAIDNSLIEVIALDFQTLSIIEDKDFTSFYNKLQSKFTLPNGRILGFKLQPN